MGDSVSAGSTPKSEEQQKRIGSAEFRNTQFSYAVGLDGVENFVATPELQSEDSIASMKGRVVLFVF